jgi:hypothetical protein
MARQKPTKWNWTGQRLKAAKLIAAGDMTQEQVAKECSVIRQTINGWCQQPEFKEKVTEFVLLDERATKAGILKRAMKSLDKKSELVETDKTTELDYLKFISDFVGHTKQNTDIQINNVEVNISEARERITSRINSIASRVREDTDSE